MQNALVLAILWAFVQWASYNYVTYYDRIWEPQIEELGIRSSDKEFWGGLVRTTLIGALTATLSIVFWLTYIIKPEWFA